MKTLRELGSMSERFEQTKAAREFIALCIAIAARKKFGVKERALEQLPARAASIFRNPLEIYRMKPSEVFYQRAAVQPGSTSSDTWGADLANYQTLANAFAESIRNYGAFDKLIAGGMRVVPMRTRVGAITVGATGATAAQFHAKVVSKLTVSSGTLTEQKASVIIAVTQELARFGDTMALDLFQRELAAGLGVETDESFLQALQSGASTFPSTGATAEGIRNDLRAALNLITTGIRSKLWLIVPPGILKTLAVVHTNAGDATFNDLHVTNGGNISGIEVVPSDGCPASTMLLVDSSQVVVANEGITIDASEQASIQMEDTTMDSPPTSSTAYVSLWQQNWVGLRAERWFAVQKLTTTGVVAITAVSYTGDSPGP
jgi:HK97 family phage major capsid protein